MLTFSWSRPSPSSFPREHFADQERLLRAIASGDRAAAETLVEQTYSFTFRSLVRMCGGDVDLAADLTQDSYRKAWESLPRFDGRARIETWLYRIAYTTFLNHVRRPHRIVALDAAVERDAESGDPTAEQLLLVSETAVRLRHAILALPEEVRFTVTAHFWGELAVKDIAEVENVTTVAIRKRLARAYAALRPVMEGDSK